MENSNSSYKKHYPSPAVVSTGCVRLKSYLSLCRPPSSSTSSSSSSSSPHHRHPSLPSGVPTAPPPAMPSLFRDGEAAAQAYWRRERQLEQELRKLDKWLSTEKRLTECLKNTTTAAAEDGRSAEMTRLSDGSYLHEIKRLGRPWGRLVMQVSAPLIAENATTAAEVLCGMASFRRRELCKCLHESMSMSNLSGHRPGQIKGKKVVMGSEEDFTEAILLASMEKMEGLALEGLRIQMGTGGRATEEVAEKKAKANAAATSKDCTVLVMLIQIRDPKEGYEAVGEPMIGFVEASAAAAGRRFDVQGVHAAGMKCTQTRTEGKDFIWSTSLKGCKGLCNSCCLQYVRNPDRFFA